VVDAAGVRRRTCAWAFAALVRGTASTGRERGARGKGPGVCGEDQGGRSGGAAAARVLGAPASVRGRGETKPRRKRGGKSFLPHRGAATVVMAEG
jgi:hypothetical protein